MPPSGEDARRLLALSRRLRHGLNDDVPAPEAEAALHDYANWVIKGRLCVGAFPCAEVFRREGRGGYQRALAGLVESGVTTFVCLEDDEDLVEKQLGMNIPNYILYDMPRGWRGEARVFSAVDGQSFSWSVLVDCLELVGGILADPTCGAVYVHCFGGHGRAGIVAACMLGLAYGLSPAEALARTQRAHDERADPAWPLADKQLSPQTEVQREQVVQALEALRTAEADRESAMFVTDSTVTALPAS